MRVPLRRGREYDVRQKCVVKHLHMNTDVNVFISQDIGEKKIIENKNL